MDAQFTIEPPPESMIAGISWRMQENVPVRSTASTRCQFSMVLSAVRLPCSPSMPAALKAASRRPKVPTAPATASFTESSSVTSQRKKAHSPSSRSSASTALPGVLVQIGEGGAPAPSHEGLGRGPADAGCGAGDEDDLARSSGRRPTGSRRQPVDHERAVTDDRLQRVLGPGQQREVGEGVAVDDDQVGERAGFDDADLRRRVHQQLPGVARCPR